MRRIQIPTSWRTAAKSEALTDLLDGVRRDLSRKKGPP
jgi:hypothetical protein